MWKEKALIAAKIAVLAVFFIPLVFTTRTMFPWHFGKTMIAQMLIAGAVILYSLVHWKSAAEHGRWTWLDKGVALFALVQLVAAFAGTMPERSLWGDQARATGVFTFVHFVLWYFLLRIFFQTSLAWQRVLSLSVAVAVVSSAVAWVGPHISLFAGAIDQWTHFAEGALSGLVGNSIFFASYLILPIFVALALIFLFQPSRVWRIVYGVAAALITLTLLFTGTRGALIGFLAGVVAFVGHYALVSASRRRRRVGLAAGLAVLLAAFGSLVYINKTSTIISDRWSAVSRILSISPTTATAQTRLLAWNIAWQGIQARPLLGWGPENYQMVFDTFYNPDFLRFGIVETVWDKPHSYLLEVGVGSGFAGIAVYVGIILCLLHVLYQSAKHATDERVKIGFSFIVGGVVAYIIQSWFAFDTSNSLIQWLVVVAFAAFSYSSPGVVPVASPLPESLSRTRPFIMSILVGLMGVSLVTSFRFYTASVLASDAADQADIGNAAAWAALAERTTRYQVPFLWEQAIYITRDAENLNRNGQLDQASARVVAPKVAQVLEKFVAERPDTYLFRFWLAKIYIIMGEFVDPSYYAKAHEQLDTARRLSPKRQHPVFLQGVTLLAQDRVDEAAELLGKLVAENDFSNEARWFYGLTLMKQGNVEKGLPELERGAAFGLQTVSSYAYLIDVYAGRKEYAKIIPLYKQLIVREPRNAGYYARLSAVYAALKDDENTVYYLNKAVELDPSLMAEATAFLKEHNIDISKYSGNTF